ncbi:MAG: alpha/beta hydrolase [Alphaproteobacteria bacterium]
MRAMILGGAILAAPAAVAAADLVERPIEAPGPRAPLHGTLLTPATPSGPAVLIIPGSGPTDRNGNSPLGIAGSIYRLLAEGLAAEGIVTVRIDKRGLFASAAAVEDPNAVTIADYATDVRAWVDAIRRATGVPCVWVLGHSEGGIVALAAAERGAAICGLLLVATPGRPAGEVLRAQLAANPANAPVLAEAAMAIATLEGGGRVDPAALHPALRLLFDPRIQGFLASLFSLDPVAMIAAVRVPVLILQGERDLQVAVADAERLAQARPGATLTLLPDTNHVLKTVRSADRGENLATYRDAGLPLAPGVAAAAAAFVKTPR